MPGGSWAHAVKAGHGASPLSMSPISLAPGRWRQKELRGWTGICSACWQQPWPLVSSPTTNTRVMFLCVGCVSGEFISGRHVKGNSLDIGRLKLLKITYCILRWSSRSYASARVGGWQRWAGASLVKEKTTRAKQNPGLSLCLSSLWSSHPAEVWFWCVCNQRPRLHVDVKLWRPKLAYFIILVFTLLAQ